MLNGSIFRLIRRILKVHAIKLLSRDPFGEVYLINRPVRDFLKFFLDLYEELGQSFPKLLQGFEFSELRTLRSLRRSLEVKALLFRLKPHDLEVYVLTSLG